MRRQLTVLAGALWLQTVAVAQPRPDHLDASNWTDAVGFAPDLASVPSYESGLVLNRSNYREFRGIVPEALARLIEEFDFAVETADYRPIHPSGGYMEATLANWGEARAVETPGRIRARGIENYRGGLPFPKPKTGLEAIWNQQFSYQGDDGFVRFRVYWVSASRGVERTEDWLWSYIVRATARTDIEPRPDVPELAARGVRYASLARCLGPDDKEGLQALMFRFDEPLDQRGFLWVPTSRRAIAMVFGAPGVPWNQTDMLFEDIRGYSGYPEWMDWTLLGTATVLAPMHARVRIGPGETERAIAFDEPPHFQPRVAFEPRPVYLVEGRPKFWTSLYGRVVLYVDAETFLVPLKEGYDRDGNLRNVILHAFNASPDEDAMPQPLAIALAVDLARRHATLFLTHETASNLGLRAHDFTWGALVRGGN